MPTSQRKHAIPIRRRPADEGEEEGSVADDVEYDSQSEASGISNGEEDADADVSEASAEGIDEQANADGLGRSRTVKAGTNTAQPRFKTSADTEAMLNGVKIADHYPHAEEIDFDDTDLAASNVAGVAPTNGYGTAMPAPQRKAAEKGRRGHQEYLKQRDSNPAFVPNRGDFFLHEDRSSLANGHDSKTYGRGGRARGFQGPYPLGGHQSQHPLTDQQWAHDLHDAVSKTGPLDRDYAKAGAVRSEPFNMVSKPGGSAPNRSFSTSAVLGTVTVRLALPDMAEPRSLPNIVKKQHTLLPHHRPPLRRDKPVRISIPDISPRYIFPSADRSFIFIPRALRPNQQPLARGRGRGNHYGSRRTSVFGGSVYSPSVAMSRKSSLGLGSRDGYHSPASGYVWQSVASAEPNQALVRLPVVQPMLGQQAVGSQVSTASAIHPPVVAHMENHVGSIPMHQPIPQKTVSVADIETPMSFNFKAPQQQQEQPFHQQMPPHVSTAPVAEDSPIVHSRRPSNTAVATGTPLSHIPEGAIYAQPFQPYPMFPQQAFYPMPYPPGTAFYHPSGGDAGLYSGSMASTVMAPAFVPGPPSASSAPAIHAAQNAMHQQSSSMVYYFDPAQMPSQGMPAYGSGPHGGVVGVGGMMTPPAFYYPPAPNGMFYGPPQS